MLLIRCCTTFLMLTVVSIRKVVQLELLPCVLKMSTVHCFDIAGSTSVKASNQ